MTDQSNNLALWDRLQTTPVSATKPFKGSGGFSGTAINGMYIIRRLTEEFGPVGQGWFFVIDEEQIVEGHTLKSGDKAKLHKIRGHVEYKDAAGAWFNTSPQFGQTMLVGENKYGTFTDEEAAKKSATDCLGKCASQLGIGADIFLGMYDDSKYINARKQEAAEEAKEAAPAATQQTQTSTPPPQSAPPQESPQPITDEDMAIARQVFHLVKGTAEKATDMADIDSVMKVNKAAMDTLKRASPKNWDGLREIVERERKRIGTAPKPRVADMDDELPDFA